VERNHQKAKKQLQRNNNPNPKIMRPIKLLLSILLFSFASVNAQDFTFKNYNWNENETKVEIPERYKNENEVILERNTKVELTVEGKTVNQYYLYHDKTYINSDDAVERNNRVYVPFGANEKVISNKLRVILKNGKVINLKDSDIKEEVDEEKGVKYNYYAVNGLEKGAVIEKFWILQEVPELDGKTYKMQDENPIAKNTFELIYPEHLEFQTKSYNGLSQAVAVNDRYPEKKTLNITESNTPALDNDEKYANWATHLKLFRFKLSSNSANGSNNLYNFNEFAGNVYERFHPELDKKQLKAIEEFSKAIPKASDIESQVWNIENKIKKTISYNRYLETKGNLSDIIKSKQANQAELLSLYLAVFDYFKIENNIVFTSNRYKIPFDSDFQSFENLSDILFYFPTIKRFITPVEIQYRIPLFPDELGNNSGLFIREKVFAGVKMGVGDVAFIDLPDQTVTHDIMDITVDFTKDIENPLITSHMIYGGYSGLNFQPIKDFVSAEEYTNILKQIAENYTNEMEYKSLKTQNDGTEFIGKKPFVMDLAFEGKNLVQKAGENYLFQVGQIIGSQMELYQDTKRTLPVEIDHPHSYLRKIKILLPDGVSVKNPEKLVLDYKTDIKGKTEAAFVSSYTTKNNELSIENTEYYNIVNYPLEHFDSYKAVINAAADFNKVVLVLHK
jgi:hypothetical protein